ncbi:GNAT family N-acetyltransferase [Haloferula sp. BvORR071]|uniref:GNAT family N-acetyltransferase n=1 Tax=Haloferula sp. BvORR071 TaxID=1396141 RepID=UPI000AE3185C|nr:GNAT family N-acetyltransferase [Haloferula sp. BvORR071]
MYLPPPFRIEDPAKLGAFIERYSFATLISHAGAAPFASHLPMLFRAETGGHGTLVSHMARANPQWQHFTAGTEVLAVFHGPHGYISPSWYKAEPAVPTWNYATVHAYGVPSIIDDHDRIVSLLEETVSRFESSFESPWPGILPEDYRDKMIRGIVAFEMPISRIEGKFKLGQNRSPEDVQGVFEALSQSNDADDQALAHFMAGECGLSLLNFTSVSEDDFEELVTLRISAMRDSLERVGRFDPERARQRLRNSFYPEHTRVIIQNGQRIGFYSFRPADDGFHLDHLYIQPGSQSRGLGSQVMSRLLTEADAQQMPVHVGALRDSPSNRFYQRHGFVKAKEDEWDIYYVRIPIPA